MGYRRGGMRGETKTEIGKQYGAPEGGDSNHGKRRWHGSHQ